MSKTAPASPVTARAQVSIPAGAAGGSSPSPQAPPCMAPDCRSANGSWSLPARISRPASWGEMLGLSYKVAWHLGQCIRTMTSGQQISLTGIVEIDEIYAGASPRQHHGGGPSGVPTGRRRQRPLVLTLVERGGRVVLERIASHSSAAIGKAVEPTVDGGHHHQRRATRLPPGLSGPVTPHGHPLGGGVCRP